MAQKVPAQVNLTLYGKPLELKFAVPADKVTPLGVLPALQQIDNQFVDTAVEAFVDRDRPISCRAGCGACCRQVVPLAEFEAYHIAAVVERLPEPRRSAVKQRFADAAPSWIGSAGWRNCNNNYSKARPTTPCRAMLWIISARISPARFWRTRAARFTPSGRWPAANIW